MTSATAAAVAAVAGASSGGAHATRAVVVAACAAATALAGLRWLRVAQREHYLADAASRFALRWWTADPVNAGALVPAVAGLVLAARWPAAALATVVVVGAGPRGLGLRGRTAPLAWTRRLRTLAGVWAALVAAALVAATLAGEGPVGGAAVALAAPALVDLACLVVAPLERRLAGAHVARASARLRRVGPRVVAITGSYGKTSTKGYVAHLLAGTMSVVASPASFNNRAGLARAVNEHLAEGTEVFVAEMGTYGPGEIADLCRWVRPEVAVITAVGPVHLERFRSEERVLAAKAEILDGAHCAVIVVDDPRLAALAASRASAGAAVWRASGRDAGAEVNVTVGPGGLAATVNGEKIATDLALEARPGNVAAAIAVALELGVPPAEVARRLPTLPTVAHRLEPSVSPSGFTVLDDTYNANPAGARVALAALARLGKSGRRVVVTPGMVELGPRQDEENSRFASEAAAVATDLVFVGRINIRSMQRGARAAAPSGVPVAEHTGAEHGDHGAEHSVHGAEHSDHGAEHSDQGAEHSDHGPDVSGGPSATPRVVVARSLAEATAWVRANLGPGDVVLYENDLPDHYP